MKNNARTILGYLGIGSFLLFAFSASRCAISETDRARLEGYGPYAPGFFDTVIFSKSKNYRYGAYNGPKPFFVRIWSPITEGRTHEGLTYHDLFSFRSNSSAAFIMDTLNRRHAKYARESTMHCLEWPDDTTLMSKSTELFRELMDTRIVSQRSIPVASRKMPVIIYHHGYEGWAADNYLFAEYMASHGYVVIASNFEWPEYEVGFDEGNDDIGELIEFALTLPFADATHVFGVGHSWGAQSMLYYDNRPAIPFSAIASLHSTTEDRDHLDTIRRLWPELSTIMLDSTRETSPTLVFAPKHHFDSFLMYRKSKSADYTFVEVSQPILHDGFISIDNMRYFISGNYSEKEDSLLQHQFLSYREICEMIRLKFEGQLTRQQEFQRLKIVD